MKEESKQWWVLLEIQKLQHHGFDSYHWHCWAHIKVYIHNAQHIQCNKAHALFYWNDPKKIGGKKMDTKMLCKQEASRRNKEIGKDACSTQSLLVCLGNV